MAGKCSGILLWKVVLINIVLNRVCYNSFNDNCNCVNFDILNISYNIVQKQFFEACFSLNRLWHNFI